MLSEKEERVLITIEKYIKKNNYSPTIRELCNLLNYKSTKTIYRYIKKLQEKNYLNYEKNKKRSIIVNNLINHKLFIINTKKSININFNQHTIIYQIKNDFFQEYSIKKGDYLMINTKRKIKNNELGLFIINKKYRIMKYNYLDGYFILQDSEQEILNKVNLVGTVIGIYRDNI